jgi:hypothetical protein
MTTSLSASQQAHAIAICTAAHRKHMGSAAAVIGVMTAKAEAGLLNLASANVPESQKHPHDFWGGSQDGLGHDHGSVGMFQQQTGWAWCPANHGHAVAPENATMDQSTMSSPDGWGKPDVLMVPVNQANLFFSSLGAVSGWTSMKPWQAAQAVQHSRFADGSNYQSVFSDAQAIVAKLWPTIEPLKPGDLPTPTMKLAGANPTKRLAQLQWEAVPGATRYHLYLNCEPTTIFTTQCARTVALNGAWTVVAMKDAAGKVRSNPSNFVTILGL